MPNVKWGCPGCGRALSARTELAGKRVRCPGCGQVVTVPASAAPPAVEAGGPAAAEAPAPLKWPCSYCGKTVSAAAALVGKRVRCPACHHVVKVPSASQGGKRPVKLKAAAGDLAGGRQPAGLLPEDAAGSAELDGASLQSAAAAHTYGRAVGKVASDEIREGASPRCHLEVKGAAGFRSMVGDRIKEILAAESLEFEVVVLGHRAGPPPALRPRDLVVTCEATEFDYGSRFIRYFLTPIALLGPGSCRLAMDVQIVDGKGGHRDFVAKARQAMGIFGGSGEGLMKWNFKIVSKRIAAGVARHVTGRRLLNQTLYTWARWSLILALLGILCFPSAWVGVILGAIALAGIVRRELPKGKATAICGVALCAIWTVITIVMLAASGGSGGR